MLKSHNLTQDKPKPKVSPVKVLMPGVEQLSEAELMELRHEIDLRIGLDLGQLNLSEELALQFRQAKNLLNSVQNDKDVATNQKAQIFNAVRGQLTAIIEQQETVWSMERLKTFEVAFVKVAHLLDAEQREVFFDLYGKYLKDSNAPGV